MTKLNALELEGYLKRNSLPNFILFTGEDIFSHEFGIKIVFSKLDLSLPEMNFCIFEGRPDVKELKSAMETIPLMSANRVVWIQKTDILSTKTKKNKNDKETDESESLKDTEDLKKSKDPYKILTEEPFPDSNYLIISTYDKASAQSILYKFFNSKGIIIECIAPDEYQSIKLIIKRAKENNIQINNATAKHLYTTCGMDMKTINSELDKLFCVCEGNINKQDVDKYVPSSFEENVFKIHDNLYSKDYNNALKILDDIATDDTILAILGLIANNFRRMLIARFCIDNGILERNTIIKIIKSETASQDWAANKAIKDCAKYNQEQIKYALKQLSDIDYKLKQGIPVNIKSSLIEIYSNRK